jgi:hypothetical protein
VSKQSDEKIGETTTLVDFILLASGADMNLRKGEVVDVARFLSMPREEREAGGEVSCL